MDLPMLALHPRRSASSMFAPRLTRSVGKEAIETMWITKVCDNDSPDEKAWWYETRAENCGSIYSTIVRVEDSEDNNSVKLSMTFEATPVTIVAKLMSPLSLLFSGTIKDAFQKDLGDIKNSLETVKS